MNAPRTVNGNKNLRTAAMAGGVALGMLGLAYASVPLYAIFCKVTGFAGTTQVATSAPATARDATIAIQFDANTSSDLGWTFQPAQHSINVKFGEVALAFFDATNNTGKTVTGTAVFNVTPAAAGGYFNKIECFCFTEQTLKAGEKVSMPVQFFVDPEMLDNPDAAGIKEITLSYTFYPAQQKTAAVKTN
jgi:cytochrome c oxidase assembly protein subunit 11